VTETGWLACTNPGLMLEFLRARASDRKRRLFACACCRRVWSLLNDPHSRNAVEVAERYADGFASEQELRDAYYTAYGDRTAWHDAASAAQFAAMPVAHAFNAARDAARAVFRFSVANRSSIPGGDVMVLEHQAQANLLRDVCGNPFHTATVDSAWLAWGGGIIPKLAQGIYDERAFDRLPVMADALEDAGCADRTILDHLRSLGPHCRGCFVVDSVRSVD
jgi:hypothetical protein